MPDINDVQVIGLWRHGGQPPEVGQGVADGVAVAHFHPLARHDVADARPRKPDAVLEDRAFGLLQPLFDPDPHLVSQRRRHVGQVLGVKPRQHFDQRGLVPPLNQRFAHGLGHFDEDVAGLLLADLAPHGHAVAERQALEHVRDVGGMHHPQALAELSEVLPMLQLLNQVSLRALLLMRQGLQHAVTIQQPRDLGQALVQTALG